MINHRPLELLNLFNSNSGRMCISVVTLAELLHGVEKSERPERNLEAVEDFSTRLDVQPYGSKAAAHYGEIRARLERKGYPLVGTTCISPPTPGAKA